MRVSVAVLAGLLCGLISTPSQGQQATAEVYMLRGRCGRLAVATFEKDIASYASHGAGGQQNFNYENHYSRKLNKCFCVEIASFFEKGGWSNSMRLYDINENKEYGHYWQSERSKIVDCIVGEARCSSEEEFRQLAKAYLEE